MIYRFLKNIYAKKLNRFCIDLGNYKNTILIAGIGRSGTTWLEEIVNYNNSYRIMFEPFRNVKVDILRKWNYHQYIRTDDNQEKYLIPASKILNGNLRNRWVDHSNKKIITNKRIVKAIRANLFLKWIRKNFPEIPIIYIIRHPCAVANSKIMLGWEEDIKNYLLQKDLMEDFLEPFKDHTVKVSDLFEIKILIWCIENYVVFKQFKKGDILVVFYESLCLNAQREINRIFTFLGEKIPDNIDNIISKPSALSRSFSAINNGTNLINSWKRYITEKQIRRSLEITRIFGLDKIYGSSEIPLINPEDIFL